MRKSTVFAQLMQLINRFQFKKSVNKHDGDRYTKSMDCWQQLIILLYAQVRGIKSLRDIEVSLRSQARKWYHLGLESVARSTLSDANSKRNSEIFRGLFYAMLDNFDLPAETIAALYKARWKIVPPWRDQMDKAEPENQNVPGNESKRRHDANLGGNDLLLIAVVYQVPDEIFTYSARINKNYR